jgi:hypothetical protein
MLQMGRSQVGVPNPHLLLTASAQLRIHKSAHSTIHASGNDWLGIPSQLCYIPTEELSVSLEGRSHDDEAACNIPRWIDPGGIPLQHSPDRLPLSHHAKPRGDGL